MDCSFVGKNTWGITEAISKVFFFLFLKWFLEAGEKRIDHLEDSYHIVFSRANLICVYFMLNLTFCVISGVLPEFHSNVMTLSE